MAGEHFFTSLKTISLHLPALCSTHFMPGRCTSASKLHWVHGRTRLPKHVLCTFEALREPTTVKLCCHLHNIKLSIPQGDTVSLSKVWRVYDSEIHRPTVRYLTASALNELRKRWSSHGALSLLRPLVQQAWRCINNPSGAAVIWGAYGVMPTGTQDLRIAGQGRQLLPRGHESLEVILGHSWMPPLQAACMRVVGIPRAAVLQCLQPLPEWTNLWF